jgi:hypothetical protein
MLSVALLLLPSSQLRRLPVASILLVLLLTLVLVLLLLFLPTRWAMLTLLPAAALLQLCCSIEQPLQRLPLWLLQLHEPHRVPVGVLLLQ